MLKQERKIKAKKYQAGGQSMSKELKTIVDLIRSGNEPMMEKKLPGMLKKLSPAQRDSIYSGKVDTSVPAKKKKHQTGGKKISSAEALPINPPKWRDKGWDGPGKPGTAIRWPDTKSRPSTGVPWPTQKEPTPKNAPPRNPNARQLSKKEASKFLGNIKRKGGSIKSKKK